MKPEPEPVERVALMLDAMAWADRDRAEAFERCAEVLRKSKESTND
jgi:hypothetical protein